MLRPTKIFSVKARHIKQATPRAESAEEIRARRERLIYGSLGPASPVRKIDPKTGRVIEVIKTTSHS